MPYSPRRGLSIPTVTALNAQNCVIEGEQRRIFRHVAQSGLGADIIFACGTTGEWNRISNTERQRLIRIQADEVARINARCLSQESTSAVRLSATPATPDLQGPFRPAPVEAWAGVTGE